MSGYLFKGLDSYDTPEGRPVSLGYRLSGRSRAYFYLYNFGILIRSGMLAKRGKLDKEAQIRLSSANISLIERMGGRVHLRGLHNVQALAGKPAVIVANHMSLLETSLFHALIREYTDFSFVIKKSLCKVPFFCEIMRAMNAIPVSRDNPREDLKTVLSEGKKNLLSGRSMIVFPQSSRMSEFDPSQFNSIGTKLAKSAGVPLLPVALKTDFLEQGKHFRDLGPVHPERDVRFEFAPPVEIEGNGQAQQQYAVDFISDCFRRWAEKKNQA